MERVVECWLDSHKDWFKKYALENLDLNTVEKWLRCNNKQVCKCNPKEASLNHIGTQLIYKSTNNLNVSTTGLAADYKMVSMTNLQSNARSLNESGGRKFSLNSQLDDIRASSEQIKTRDDEKQRMQGRKKLNCINCIIHKRKLHNNNFEARLSDAEVMPDSVFEPAGSNTNGSQNMNDTVIPIIVDSFNQEKPEPDTNEIKTVASNELIPPNSSLNLLKCLIKSKIKFQSNVKQARSKFKVTKEINLSDTKHLLELIKDISRELHLKQLVERIVCNTRLLVNAEHANVYFVCQNKQRLASFKCKKPTLSMISLAPRKSVSGATIFDDTLNDFDHEMPFGSSLLGKVALTGNLVNVLDVTKVCLLLLRLVYKSAQVMKCNNDFIHKF